MLDICFLRFDYFFIFLGDGGRGNFDRNLCVKILRRAGQKSVSL